jgi:type I restriction enzyme M protein
MTSTAIVNKVWNFCHTLRDDGVGYGDYLEQLTYLLFLKMADEYSKPPYNRDTHIPKGSSTGRACAARAAPSWRATT